MKNEKTEFSELYGKLIDADIEKAEAAASTDVEPSEAFKSRMAELIKAGKPNDKRAMSKRTLRIIIAAATILLLLACAACIVPIIKRQVVGKLISIDGSGEIGHVNLDSTKRSIEEEYVLSPVPEGFELKESVRTDYVLTLTYANEKGDTVNLAQSANGRMQNTVDSVSGVHSRVDLRGAGSVDITVSEEYTHAFWTADGYYFSLSCSPCVDAEEICELISTVKPEN